MSGVIVCALSAWLGIGVPGPKKMPDPPQSESPFAAKFAEMKKDMNRLLEKFQQAYAAAETEKDKEAVAARMLEGLNRDSAALAGRALALAKPRAADPFAVEVFTWIVEHAPGSDAANEAAELLLKHHLKNARTQSMVAHFVHAPLPWTEKLLRALAAADLPRDQKALALFQLAQSLQAKAEVPALLGFLDPAMKQMVETQFGKAYLDTLRKLDTAKIEDEAVALYKEVGAKYGDVVYGTQKLGDTAAAAVFEIRNLSIGKTAPEITGKDIDGRPMRLSDFRGKVVVLDFWGNW